MQIQNVSNLQNFKGLLQLQGPNKKTNPVVINTESMTTIHTQPYLGKPNSEESGIAIKENAVISMNNGMTISTYSPLPTVVEAYKKAQVAGDYTLETQYNPLVEKTLF